jgi:hypothetical protein
MDGDAQRQARHGAVVVTGIMGSGGASAPRRRAALELASTVRHLREDVRHELRLAAMALEEARDRADEAAELARDPGLARLVERVECARREVEAVLASLDR